MGRRKVTVHVLVLLILAAGWAAAGKFTATPRDGNLLYDEQVVAGHSVFATLEVRRLTGPRGEGFDVAVLVRDVRQPDLSVPWVAWFNDQWKTMGSTGGNEDGSQRYPCGGYVLATGTNPNATTVLDEARAGRAIFRYQESYYITDPNGYVSETHLYSARVLVRSVPVWVTTVLNSYMDDDGVSACAPLEDEAPQQDPGMNGRHYHGGASSPARLYNADIFGMWEDVPGTEGVKQHGDGGLHSGDATGCAVGTEWDCGNDDEEGNSHAFHGNSTHQGEAHNHQTGQLTLLFTSVNDFLNGFPPSSPRWRIYDTNMVEPEVSGCESGSDGDGWHRHC